MPEDNQELYQKLADRIERELKTAAEKQADRSYWLNVGDIEKMAASEARHLLETTDRELPPEIYLAALTSGLDRLACRWRQSDYDEDGYGVGTIHAIGRLLPDYTGR